MRLLALIPLLAAPLLAQPFTLGIKAGAPLNDFIHTAQTQSVTSALIQNFNFTSSTRRYVVGPTIELRLPAGFAIEADALYRRMNYNGSTPRQRRDLLIDQHQRQRQRLGVPVAAQIPVRRPRGAPPTWMRAWRSTP